MDLEKAVDLIVARTMGWVEGNKGDNPGFIYSNFASVFLHNCQILRMVPHFQKWGNLKFLKAKWVTSDICENGFGKVRFNISGLDVHNQSDVYELNEELQKCISNKRYIHYADYFNQKGIQRQFLGKTSVFVTEEPKILFDVKKLQDFKF